MIKNNIKIALTVVALASVIIGGIANAADLNFSDDTVISIGSHNYTILHGSKATTMQVTPTTLVVTVPSGYSLTFVSYDGYALGTGGAIAQSCSAGTNIITVTGGPITVTPNASSTVCTVSGAGSGGSSGSSSSSSTTTADTTPPTSTSIVIAGGASSTTSATVALTLAATGATQMMISNDAAFTGGAWETYSASKSWTLSTGSGAKTVYAKFRDAASNVSTAVSDTITYSPANTTETTTTTTTTPTTTTTTTTTPTLSLPYANPTTTVEIAANRTALINYIVTLLQARQTATVSGIPAGFQFTTTLKQGSTGNDVKYLQIFLNSDSATSIGNAGKETTYFGSATKAAVGKFQIKYGLAGVSNAGYGQVGPITRAKINSLIGL